MTYVMSDLHGAFDKYVTMLEKILGQMMNCTLSVMWLTAENSPWKYFWI